MGTAARPKGRAAAGVFTADCFLPTADFRYSGCSQPL